MANVTIKTNLTNVADGASSTTSASLDGIPFTTSTIINSRVFTINTNHTFTVEPFIDLSGVSVPTDYSVTTTKVAGTSKTFTVKYHHPLKPPTTDVIQFFATAKLNPIRSNNKIYNYQINEKEINGNGESRVLTVNGNPNSSFSLDVTKNPKINPIGDQTIIDGPLSYYVVDDEGKYETTIRFPKTTLLTNYKVKLSERISGSFSGISNPSTVTLTQYPLHQLKLELLETTFTSWTIPSVDFTSNPLYFSGPKGEFSTVPFSFIVTSGTNISTSVTDTVDGAFTGTTMTLDTNYATKHTAVGDIISGTSIVSGTTITAVNVGGVNDRYTISQAPSAEVADGATITFTKPSFTPSSFTQVTGQSSTLTDTAIDSIIEYSGLKAEIRSGLRSVEISGNLKIVHGYDSGGHTYLTLNINDILYYA